MGRMVKVRFGERFWGVKVLVSGEFLAKDDQHCPPCRKLRFAMDGGGLAGEPD